MRDKTHKEQIIRWARHVKNSDSWKAELNSFIDAQIEIARRAYNELSKTNKGKLKIKKLKTLQKH